MNSFWIKDRKLPSFKRLRENLKTDVAIVGAGISGITTAYFLNKEGKSVILLEDGLIAHGETGRTTAHISNALDDRYQHLFKLHGAKNTELAAKSHTSGIKIIKEIVESEKIDCDFEILNGYLFLDPKTPPTFLDEEYKIVHQIGLDDVKKLPRAPIDSFHTGPCLEFPGQAQFHPTKYISALSGILEKRGVQIFTKTHVRSVKENSNKVSLKTRSGFEIECKAAVIATNTPINDLVTIHTKQAAYRTYVIGALIKKKKITPALFWDTEDPYHYVRLQKLSDHSFDLLIVGGEDHKTGQDSDSASRFEKLFKWAKARFPIKKIEYQWSGQIMEPIDGLSFIGRNPGNQNVFIITGDSGNGITHGTFGGILIADLITGRKNPWAKLYDPSRKNIKSIKNFLKENMSFALHYLDLFKAFPTSTKSLTRDSGMIVNEGVKKIAVYRDQKGLLHRRSAVCPHLGCIVQWNNAEKSWDCPCHGSRFTSLGRVINGPSTKNLSRMK